MRKRTSTTVLRLAIRTTFGAVPWCLIATILVFWIRSYYITDSLGFISKSAFDSSGNPIAVSSLDWLSVKDNKLTLRRNERRIQSGRGRIYFQFGQADWVFDGHPQPPELRWNVSEFVSNEPSSWWSATRADSFAPTPMWNTAWNSGLSLGLLNYRRGIYDHHPLHFGVVQIQIPYWPLVALPTALLAYLKVRALWNRSRSLVIRACGECGYDLRATPDRCPECGKSAIVAGPDHVNASDPGVTGEDKRR